MYSELSKENSLIRSELVKALMLRGMDAGFAFVTAEAFDIKDVQEWLSEGQSYQDIVDNELSCWSE